MHLLKVTLSGKELWRLIMEMEKNRMFLRHFHMIGMSFRGKIFGDIGYRGISVNREKTGCSMAWETVGARTTIYVCDGGQFSVHSILSNH